MSFIHNQALVAGNMPEPKMIRVVIDAPFCLGVEARLISVAEITQRLQLCYLKKNYTAEQTGTEPRVCMNHFKERKRYSNKDVIMKPTTLYNKHILKKAS